MRFILSSASPRALHLKFLLFDAELHRKLGRHRRMGWGRREGRSELGDLLEQKARNRRAVQILAFGVYALLMVFYRFDREIKKNIEGEDYTYTAVRTIFL